MADYEYHEPLDRLKEEDLNFHRALKSLQEELEAVDWYNQRAAACKDDSLKKIILHNRNEEMEHAAMLLEWLRRNMPPWEKYLRQYLFTEAPIELVEAEAESKPGKKMADLGIGDLKKEKTS